ncbi:ATP-binding cassette domain-containing protein [Streptomyces sp. NPDC056154]|uniref:ATP-binding cassette domain-containing protein n=1 Tax=unclassified Streptomyces TaxID=2593676 RepID=UPI0035DA8AC7
MSGRRTCGGLVVLGLLAAACGSTGSGADPDGRPTGSAAGFPVVVEDCAGVRTTFDAPVRRIVTSNASGLELLLRLGASDRVIGTGFPPGRGALPKGLAAQAAAVPVLGRTVIPKERLLGSAADVYLEAFASMGGTGDDNTVPGREEYRAAGIKVVQLRAFAGEDGTDRAVVTRALGQVGLAGYGNRRFSALSGGERQRALLARAFAQDPDVLVPDEPTNHLDVRHQVELLSLLRAQGRTTLVSLHDLDAAASVCDRLHVLHEGVLVASGTPLEVLTPALLAEVFGVRAAVVEHPLTGDPLIAFDHRSAM